MQVAKIEVTMNLGTMLSLEMLTIRTRAEEMARMISAETAEPITVITEIIGVIIVGTEGIIIGVTSSEVKIG